MPALASLPHRTKLSSEAMRPTGDWRPRGPHDRLRGIALVAVTGEPYGYLWWALGSDSADRVHQDMFRGVCGRVAPRRRWDAATVAGQRARGWRTAARPCEDDSTRRQTFDWCLVRVHARLRRERPRKSRAGGSGAGCALERQEVVDRAASDAERNVRLRSCVLRGAIGVRGGRGLREGLAVDHICRALERPAMDARTDA